MGIAGVNLQDVCVTENEGPGPIMDRTKEHLCAGDISTIKARLKLLDASEGTARKRNMLPRALKTRAFTACAALLSLSRMM